MDNTSIAKKAFLDNMKKANQKVKKSQPKTKKLKATYVREFTGHTKSNFPVEFTLYKIHNSEEDITTYVAYETEFLDKFDIYELPTIWGNVLIED